MEKREWVIVVRVVVMMIFWGGARARVFGRGDEVVVVGWF